MSKVIQIRDVPDRVHAALVEAAEAEGLSLTGYLQRELTWLADQPAIARHNMDVIYATQAAIGVSLDRETIAQALAEGRAER
jgi:hypothetical protein